MDDGIHTFRSAVGTLADKWNAQGLPSRQELEEAAKQLGHRRKALKVPGIWKIPPSMVTATLDDGLGQGITIIETFARSIGIRLISLGLMQPPRSIIDACHRHRPDYMGVTILQFDTEENLALIAKALPAHTRIVAGGPVFSGDPDFANRTGIHYVAKDVAAFLRFMLDTDD